MAVAFKSLGAAVENTAGSTVAVPIPDLDPGDVVLVNLWGIQGTDTPVFPAGWAQTGDYEVDSNLRVWTFWRYATSTEAAHTENFASGTGSTAVTALAAVHTGADNSAPIVQGLARNTTAVAYWQSPALTGAGYRFSNALLFAARSSSGTFTTSGSVTSTNTSRLHQAALGSLRFAAATYDVTAAAGGFIRATIGGGSSTSTVRTISFTEATAGTDVTAAAPLSRVVLNAPAPAASAGSGATNVNADAPRARIVMAAPAESTAAVSVDVGSELASLVISAPEPGVSAGGAVSAAVPLSRLVVRALVPSAAATGAASVNVDAPFALAVVRAIAPTAAGGTSASAALPRAQLVVRALEPYVYAGGSGIRRVFRGALPVEDIKIGGVNVVEVRLGSVQVWSR